MTMHRLRPEILAASCELKRAAALPPSTQRPGDRRDLAQLAVAMPDVRDARRRTSRLTARPRAPTSSPARWSPTPLAGSRTAEGEADTARRARGIGAARTTPAVARAARTAARTAPITVARPLVARRGGAARRPARVRASPRALVLDRAAPRRRARRRHGPPCASSAATARSSPWNGQDRDRRPQGLPLAPARPRPAVAIAERVAERAARARAAVRPHRGVQDIVQEELMTAATSVAERYILYRAERAMPRSRERRGARRDAADALPVVEADGATRPGTAPTSASASSSPDRPRPVPRRRRDRGGAPPLPRRPASPSRT